MTRTRTTLVIGAIAALAAAGGIGIALAVGSSAGPGAPAVMMGGGQAPQWTFGCPGDPGRAMGARLAGAPGPRVSPADATRLGDETPAGATVDRGQGRIVFSASDVRFAAVASPAGGPDETFRIAGLADPAVVVPAGARVTVQVINADPDTAHGFVVTDGNVGSARMPMMTAAPAFPGAAVWALGNPTAAGLHTATITFTASPAGAYTYLCTVPGHAAEGMTGTFVVRGG